MAKEAIYIITNEITKMAQLPEVREIVLNETKTAPESYHQLSSNDGGNRPANKKHSSRRSGSLRPSHGAKPRARKGSMMGALVGGVNFGLSGAIAGAAIGHTVERVAEVQHQRKVDNKDNGERDVQQRTCVIV